MTSAPSPGSAGPGGFLHTHQLEDVLVFGHDGELQHALAGRREGGTERGGEEKDKRPQGRLDS